jgi:hypothetical protein
MRKILIVSPHFPPISAPDMQRVRMSLPYYPSSGWDPVVLAVGEEWVAGVREPELTDTLPAGLRIVRTRAMPTALSKWIGLGTLGLRSLPYLLAAGSRLLRQEKFDLVFFSNTQFITFILGPYWKRRFGVPYVLDFQDPWRTDHYELPGSRRPPGGWKYRFARLQARLFERRTVAQASAVMSVSADYLNNFRRRYPEFAGKPTAVLPFGASAADLIQARKIPATVAGFSRKNGERHVLYTGAAGPIAPRAFDLLFAALSQFRKLSPNAGRLKFHFVGTSYAPSGTAQPSILAQAEAHGVLDQVTEAPHRIGFIAALQLQQEADALLLLASADPAYSPSKVFLYYLIGKPILGLVYRGSVMERLLDELSCAYLVRTAENAPPQPAIAALQVFFEAILAGNVPPLLPPRDPAFFENHYLAEQLTRRQCQLFEAATSSS